MNSQPIPTEEVRKAYTESRKGKAALEYRAYGFWVCILGFLFLARKRVYVGRFVNEDDYETNADNDPICRDCGQIGTWTGYERGIDQVIVGGESGPYARPLHPDWARSIRDQCQVAGVAFFFKQHGEFVPASMMTDSLMPSVLHCERFDFEDGQVVYRVGRHKAGRLLDGREYNQFKVTNES